MATPTVSPALTSPSPLKGLKVVEFSHMVMGPAVGLMLADLGANVIKVEPVEGDKTRNLKGAGAGYFPMFNRNKRSLAIDLKSEAGKSAARKLVKEADIFIENFRPGALTKLGFDYETLSKDNEKLIYCSEKGFLAGPYENRTALDEVAQMMGGLAYMTGPPGRPLRAGSSVIDITGGMFGVIAILSALHERTLTGKGRQVSASLFETTVFMVGQHMAQYGVTGTPAAPMPERVSAWAVYDVFDVANDEKVFVGVVSDGQWRAFCEAFEFADWAADETLAKNNDRVARREEIIPRLRETFLTYSKADLMERLSTTGLPFAPISRPEELFEDPHLLASGGLLDMKLPNGADISLPALPLSIDGQRPGLVRSPPRRGEHTAEILTEIGLTPDDIDQMTKAGQLNCDPDKPTDA